MSDNRWREFYGREASGYDDVRYGSRYGVAFREAHRLAFESIVEKVGVTNARSLDVASGTGQLVPSIANISQLLIAADLTPEMLIVSRQKYPFANVVFTQMDAFQSPFESKIFDLVVSSRFLHLFSREEQVRLLGEMARVCGEHGAVIVDFYNRLPRQILSPFLGLYRLIRKKRAERDHYASPAEARRIFEEAGLHVQMERGIGSYGLAPFLWLPIGARVRLMGSRLFSSKFLAEQWIVVGRPVP